MAGVGQAHAGCTRAAMVGHREVRSTQSKSMINSHIQTQNELTVWGIVKITVFPINLNRLFARPSLSNTAQNPRKAHDR